MNGEQVSGMSVKRLSTMGEGGSAVSEQRVGECCGQVPSGRTP